MGYADENYEKSRALYDQIAQVFEDYKYGAVSSGHTWNLPIQEIKGVTMRFRGENLLEITYHRYEVTTVEGMARAKQDNDGLKFVEGVVKQLKKEFKEATGKQLALEKVKDMPWSPEKASRLTADTSWMLGSSRYGHGSRPVGRYLVRSTRVYKFDASL